MTLRLAVLVTHPIQYFAPLFRCLAESSRIDLHVFYGWEGATRGAMDHGFGQVIQWDIPLLDGYQHTILPNESADPGTHHFGGITNGEVLPRIRAWAPDAVMIFGWNYRSHLDVLRQLHGSIPIFFRGDSTLLDEHPGPRRLLRRMWLRWVYRHVDAALYVGTHNKDYYVAHGLRESQLSWAPHSVDNDRFADLDGTLTREAREWRRSLGIDDAATVVLFAGKLESKKAPDVLLEAFLQRQRETHEHLVFVGTGPLESALRERSIGKPNVHFLGFQNQSKMPLVYRLGEVFVLPSRGPGETWGLAINESMASGRPVIVTDRVGCAPDLVVRGGSGLVVPAESVPALASAITELSANVGRREQMAAAGRREIARWSLSEQARRIQDAVEQRVQQNSRAA